LLENPQNPVTHILKFFGNAKNQIKLFERNVSILPTNSVCKTRKVCDLRLDCLL